MSAKPEHYDLIKKPVITEKATMASENGTVVFQVAMDATKPMIKEAVEAIFGVKVKAVNIVVATPMAWVTAKPRIGPVRLLRKEIGREKFVERGRHF